MENRKLDVSSPESKTNSTYRGIFNFRITALLIAMSVTAVLSFCFAAVILKERQTSDLRLSQTVNPNTAAVESLARLPGIGSAKAGEIVSYRDDFRKENPGQSAFQNIADLQKVKGIGPKTAQNIYKHLDFN
jgi:competence ComEA-like helix-hairpin-helix protein